MPSPKLNTVVRRPDLGGIVEEMMAASGQLGYIGTTLLPIRKVGENAGVYPVIPKEALMKNVNPARAPKSAYVRTNYEYERGTYMTYEYGVEEVVDDVEREMMSQEAPGAADRLAAHRIASFLLRAQERRIANMFFSAAAKTRFGATAVTNEWDDFANCTPISDVKGQLQNFRLKNGQSPDALVVNWEVYNNLTQSAEIIDQIKYTFGSALDIRNLTEGQVAQALGVPRLIVAGGLQDTAGFGLDSTIGDIWSNEYAALVSLRGSFGSSLGNTFMWTRDANGVIMEQYREEAVRGDVYRARHYVGENFTASVDETGTIVSDVAADNIILFDNITS